MRYIVRYIVKFQTTFNNGYAWMQVKIKKISVKIGNCVETGAQTLTNRSKKKAIKIKLYNYWFTI